MAENPAPDRAPTSNDDPAIELLRRVGPRPPVPTECEARVRRAVYDHWRRGVAARRRHLVAWIMAPLAAAALVLLVVRVTRLDPVASQATVATVELTRGAPRCMSGGVPGDCAVGTVLAAGDTVVTGDDRAALRMAGGGSLRLDRETELLLTAPGRVDLRRGAVYFDSAPTDAGLQVRTELAAIRDVGTQLEVRVADGGLKVRVREGRAEVRGGVGSFDVASGEELSIQRNGATRFSTIAATDNAWGWVLAVAPPFALEGSSAGAFLRWVARESGLHLRWASPELPAAVDTMVLHGEIASLTPAEAPKAVLPTCGLEYRIEEGALVVGRAGAR